MGELLSATDRSLRASNCHIIGVFIDIPFSIRIHLQHTFVCQLNIITWRHLQAIVSEAGIAASCATAATSSQAATTGSKDTRLHFSSDLDEAAFDKGALNKAKANA